MQAPAQVSSRRQVKVQASIRDAERPHIAQVLASGVLTASLLVGSPALAADLALGKQVFEGNCAACHAGGEFHRGGFRTEWVPV